LSPLVLCLDASILGIEIMKSRVEIYKGWCKKCGICVAFCPHGVLDINKEGYPFVAAPENCKGCDWCDIRCPDFAIMVSRDEKNQKE
jgi:2-oxoglutarate ferredoxin oxidoreductase subunit delta